MRLSTSIVHSSHRDTHSPDQYEVELTDLSLARVPSRYVHALDGTDRAVIDGLLLRRHHDAQRHPAIIVSGHGTPPEWIR